MIDFLSEISILFIRPGKFPNRIELEKNACKGSDIDRDGDRDVWLLFSLCYLVTNEALDPNSTELLLSGMTLDGVPFTARDSVEIIGQKPPKPIVPIFVYPVDGTPRQRPTLYNNANLCVNISTRATHRSGESSPARLPANLL